MGSTSSLISNARPADAPKNGVALFSHLILNCFGIAGVLFVVILSGCSPSATAITANPTESQGSSLKSVIQVSSLGDTSQDGAPAQRIDLGSIKQGSTVRKMVSIENHTSSPISIDHIEASCECTSFPNLPLNVPAGGSGQLKIIADESHETEFHGDLAIQATAFDHTRPLFKFEIDLSVGATKSKSQPSTEIKNSP
jgi:hypothetical protein